MRCEQILYATKRVPHQLHTHPSHPSHPSHLSHLSLPSLPPPSILIVVNTNPCCYYCSSLKNKIKDIFIASPIHTLLPSSSCSPSHFLTVLLANAVAVLSAATALTSIAALVVLSPTHAQTYIYPHLTLHQTSGHPHPTI